MPCGIQPRHDLGTGGRLICERSPDSGGVQPQDAHRLLEIGLEAQPRVTVP